MSKAAPIIDIFLQPGEFYFGDRDTRIRTLLGSCVAITLWHAGRRIGGMCHYMLPTRKRGSSSALDGRYADDALQLFMREVVAARTAPSEYEAKLFGGGNMFQPSKKTRYTDVPNKNMEAGRALLASHGFQVHAEDLGGQGHRQIIFDIGSGAVWVRRHPLTKTVDEG
jgi:chemotaxis protein CheD